MDLTSNEMTIQSLGDNILEYNELNTQLFLHPEADDSENNKELIILAHNIDVRYKRLKDNGVDVLSVIDKCINK